MKLLYIQTIIPSYREHVINELEDVFELHVIAQDSNKNGHETLCDNITNMHREKTKSIFFGKLTYQTNTIKNIRRINPEIILSHSDIKNISCWMAMVYAKIRDIPYYSYGHGPYKKISYIFLYRIIYRIMLKFHSGYIAYNEYSKLSFKKLLLEDKKIYHINNTVKFQEEFIGVEKTGLETGILFLGRVRKNSGLESLIDACEKIRSKINITIHIIGSGEELENIKLYTKDKQWIKIYGKIFDSEKIYAISKLCRIGCYPGAAGLSVVHYFSLSLPPLVKKSIEQHMGPEPAYINDNLNGFHFEGTEDFPEVLSTIFSLPTEKYIKISKESLQTYINLSSVNFAKSLLKIYESTK